MRVASGLVDEPGVFIFGVKHDEPDFVQMMDAVQVQSGSHRTFHVVMVNRTSDLKPQGAKTSGWSRQDSGMIMWCGN